MKRGRKVIYRNMKGFESDMIVYGWDLMLFKDDTGAEPSGYVIYGRKPDDMETRRIYIVNDKGYWFVLFPQDEEGKQRRVPLHKVIYAYYCGWKTLDIMEGQNIHHIDRNRKNNDIENLVALTCKEHCIIHYIDKATKSGYTFTQEQLDDYADKWTKILGRACAIRDNTIKARGRKVRNVSDIIWED